MSMNMFLDTCNFFDFGMIKLTYKQVLYVSNEILYNKLLYKFILYNNKHLYNLFNSNQYLCDIQQLIS